MNSSANLQEYLHQIRRRLRVTTASRGLGGAALTALIATIVCVFIANRFAFSDGSVVSARTLLFAAVIAAVVLLLVLPLRALTRRRAASQLEKSVPAFEGRIATFVDETARRDKPSPLLDLLAEDAMRVADTAPVDRVFTWQRIASYAATAVVAVVVLMWLGNSGPGYWGYGTARLWGGWLKPMDAPLYQIVVAPGDTTMRQGADLTVTAEMVGFEPATARLFAKFESGMQWEEAPMQRRIEGNGFEFLFAGVREPLQYYISAEGVRSDGFEVQVVEMPNVENIRLTYRYPKWSSLEQLVEDPGGDIRAVDGTEVEIEVTTDKPLPQGVLVLNDNEQGLRSNGSTAKGSVKVTEDGQYYLGAVYQGETVRLTEDFFVTMVPDNKPEVKLMRPGRDWRATNIEEVVAEFEANDDFGLSSLELHYSVNGGDLQKVPLRKSSGGKQVEVDHTFFLEELGTDGVAAAGKPQLVPGDIVSYYAVAKDHKMSVQTDMYFIEVQPFEREFFQSQQGGGGMAGGSQQQDEISRRQKEILAATWNLIKEKQDSDGRGKAEVRDNAEMLSEIQLTLREQAQTLAERTRARQLASTNSDFASFVENLEKAAEFMQPAADTLRAQKLDESIPSQQKALQHLLRAESIFREIQVSFGGGGGGGGGGQAGRDLAEMFELEMDLEKNQYETGGGASSQQLEREIDEQLEKLRELARRQEKLAEQRQREQNPTFAQRWQQEMLRREAEDLKRKLEELQQRQMAQNQQQSQQGQQGQQGQSGQQGSSGSAGQPRLDNIIKQLEQATQDMQASQNQQGQQGEQGQQQGQQGQQGRQGQSQTQAQAQAAASRAQARLEEALRQLDQQRREAASSSLSDIAERAGELAQQQGEIAPQITEALRKALAEARAAAGGDENSRTRRRGRLSSGLTRQQERDLSEQKLSMHQELEDLERRMQETIRGMSGEQRKTATRVREALVNLQQEEVSTRLRVASEYIRQGAAPYIASSEDAVTRSLEDFRDQMREAERLASAEGSDSQGPGLERSLARLEELRRQLEDSAGFGQRAGDQRGPGQQGQEGQQGQGQQGQGQQPGQGQQQGQQGQGQQGQGQQAGQGQQGGQQGQGQGGQQGGSQPGNGLADGNQPPGMQPGWGRGGGGQNGPRAASPSASNYGDWGRPSGMRAADPETRAAMEQALREGAGQIPELTNELRNRGIYNEDLEEIRRFVRGLPDSRFRGNPELLESEYQRMLALLEQLELQVRRQVETAENTEVRAIVSEPVPEQYREAVAEYFRRLSKGK